jgi:lysophospholipase L1-like esterase
LRVRFIGAAVAAGALIALALPAVASARFTGKPVGSAPAPKAKTKPKSVTIKRRYYLALGDSLSRGMQPNVNGLTVNTNQGYVNQLFKIEHKRIAGLKLVQLGCGGETTGSMITGKGNPFATINHCKPKGGSQLKAAKLFLKSHHHRGEVPLITIDIGANDVDSCATSSDLVGCVTAGEAAIKKNLPVILSALRKAAPKGTKFAGMNLYDPVLSGYFSTNPNTKSLAMASPVFLKQVNGDIESADAAAKFVTADVADAFSSYDSTDTVPFDGQSVPLNVARVCSWTWACTTPPSGPNIHANLNGYFVMAQAFNTAIGKLKKQ